ncbi:MAG TPA: ABC transporter ATP-binding protein [Candidatus Acidoferrales bacterium]|nr:ABC transporter ATP-binding protein [Candidatus Acidoferrales bacterium]
MIELVNLMKRYGSTLAVDDLSLEVRPGEIFGFLGPNGAGKTTTIRMMMGLLQPTSGTVRLGGHDLATEPIAAKQLCGFVPDRPHIYEKLTGAEFLDFVAGLYHVPATTAARRRDELLDMFDLAQWATELVEGYSHGMKQRLVMAAALIHAPRLLIVDEPMVGMDPRGARLLKRTFRQLARNGVTVFMSTHSLEVAEETCDRVGIINQGRLVAVGTVDELRRQAGGHANSKLETIFLKLTGGDDVAELLTALRA